MPVFIKREYDYALRICAYLAGNYKSGPIPVSKIAKVLFISRPFTTKIVFRLKQNKIVQTVQGRDGGVFLDHSPEDLSIFDILQAIGFDSTLNECIKHPRLCPLVAMCAIHIFFIEEENRLIHSFKEKKIAEFAFSDTELKINN